MGLWGFHWEGAGVPSFGWRYQTDEQLAPIRPRERSKRGVKGYILHSRQPQDGPRKLSQSAPMRGPRKPQYGPKRRYISLSLYTVFCWYHFYFCAPPHSPLYFCALYRARTQHSTPPRQITLHYTEPLRRTQPLFETFLKPIFCYFSGKHKKQFFNTFFKVFVRQHKRAL